MNFLAKRSAWSLWYGLLALTASYSAVRIALLHLSIEEQRLLVGLGVVCLSAAVGTSFLRRLYQIGELHTRHTVFLVAFAWLLCWFSVWYAGVYPGAVIPTDSSIMLSTVTGIEGYTQYSNAWGAFFSGLYWIFGTLQVVPITQLVLVAAALAYFVHGVRLLGAPRWLIALTVVALSVLPAVPLSAILWSHDTASWALRIGIAAICINLVAARRSGESVQDLALLNGIAFLIAASVLVRSENLWLVAVVPFLLAFYGVMPGRRAIAVAGLCAAYIGGFALLIAPRFYANPGVDYSLTILANPLRYFYNSTSFASSQFDRDRTLMENVLGKDWLTGQVAPYAPYNTKGLRVASNFPAEQKELKERFVPLVLQNKTLFVRNRLKMASVLISGDNRVDYHCLVTQYYPDNGALDQFLTPAQREIYRVIAKEEDTRVGAAETTVSWLMKAMRPAQQSGEPLRRVLWSLAPGVLFVIVGALALPSRRPEALPAAILILPMVTVLLLAPAAHFKYMTDVYVLGLFVPLLLYSAVATRTAIGRPRAALPEARSSGRRM